MLAWAATPAECAALADWAAARIPHVGALGFAECRAAGVLRGGELVAAVLFHEWNPLAATIQLSMASATPLWASRAVIADLFRYAFVVAQVNKLWTAIPHDLVRAIRFNEGIGMKREATLRHQYGPKRHAVICSMLRDEWARSRWHEGVA